MRITPRPRLDGYASLAGEVVAASSRPDSRHHGEQHWKAVAWAGLQLAHTVRQCDAELVLLFALFHDSRRFNEGHDPDHGLRGGELAREMCGTAFQLDPDRLATLTDACARHDRGQTAGDTTTGVCWDADRLNLWRVGTTPDLHFLSTSAAPDLIAEAWEFHGREYDWESLFAAYADLYAAANRSNRAASRSRSGRHERRAGRTIDFS